MLVHASASNRPSPSGRSAGAVRTSRRPSSAERVRVLVVEDDVVTSLHLEEILERLGFGICDAVATARGAVAAAEAHRPTLVLMDIRLARDGDGVEAAREIRESYGIPCIFTTAHSDARTVARAEEARPLGFLFKPYSEPNVDAALRDALTRLGRSVR